MPGSLTSAVAGLRPADALVHAAGFRWTAPLGELDVAALAAFLLGPHGKSITGQNYVICGGASL
ncbi:hypothetical protein [Paenarthrobacter nitroguajacolicus]|uniref:hypothetical protein n=1 Tax=Paenarthrobacter nitroguajacolicus TaxID=211146 RepID=UPI001ABF10D5|nr:hypothetical protein [Paenarthrobacter nitroguajacolicus]